MNKDTLKKIKCFVNKLVLGHSKTAQGEEVSGYVCRGCMCFVFMRNKK